MSGTIPLLDSDDAPESLEAVAKSSAPPQDGPVVAPPEVESAPPAGRRPETEADEELAAEGPESPAEELAAEGPEPRDEPVQEPTAQGGTDTQTPAADGTVPVDAADVPAPAQESAPVGEPAEKEPVESEVAAEAEASAEAAELGESVEVVDSVEEQPAEPVEPEPADPEESAETAEPEESAEPGEPVEVVDSVELEAAEEADAAEKTAAGTEEPAQEEQPAEAAEPAESEAAETQPAESAVKPESVEPTDSAAESDAVEPAVESESAESETVVEAAGPVEVVESGEPNESVESVESVDVVVESDVAEEVAAGSGTAAEEAQSAEPAIEGEPAEETVDESTPVPPSAGAPPTERASEVATASASVAHPPLRPNFSLSAPTPATAAEPAIGAPSRTIEYPADDETADMPLPPSVPIAARTPERDDASEEADGAIGTIGRVPADSEAEEAAAAPEATDDEPEADDEPAKVGDEQASAESAPSEPAPAESAPSEPAPSEPAPAEQKESGVAEPARRRRLPLILGAAAALLVLLWGAAAFTTTQRIFAGSTVSGVAVGDMSPAQAESTVADAINAQLGQPVTLVVGEATDTLVPAESGVSVDARASVERLTGFTLNPITLVERLSGADVDAVTRVDARSLTTALDARLDTLAVGVSNAGVTLRGTTPVLVPGSIGTGLDVDSAVTALSEDWPLGRGTIELPDGEARPAVTDEEAQTLIDKVLTPMLSGDLTITAEGTDAAARASQTTVALTPEQLAGMVRIDTAGGDITASLDPQGLREAVLAAMGQGIETPAQDATWTIEGRADAKPVYVEAHGGAVVDAETLAANALTAATRDGGAGGRRIALPVINQAPAVTTPAADWGMNQVVGEYSTPYYPDAARTQNLVAGTAAINGTVVMPGGVFSLTDALGQIDEEHGFASAGVVTNGQHTDAMGGGLSQVATTVFNAGFEAGMDDVEHTPHNYWFTRYPAGREATLWTGNLDVKFGNSTPTAVMVQAWAVDGEVHVRLWGTPYYSVSIDNGTPHNYRAYQTQRQKGANCVPYGGGAQGFDITVTRSRTKPNGEKLPDDVLNTSYDSDNPVVCS